MKDFERRFTEKIRASDGCWEWLGARNPKGYGLIKNPSGGRPLLLQAHRAAWMIFRGEIPTGLSVCHRCDNRGCVNPAHLFLGTHTENMADMVAKGRQAKGERVAAAKLDEMSVGCLKRLCDAGVDRRFVADRYGVSLRHVQHIMSGKKWKHLNERKHQ